jgi:hypothetical protein
MVKQPSFQLTINNNCSLLFAHAFHWMMGNLDLTGSTIETSYVTLT